MADDPDPIPSVPPLPHEVMGQVVRGFRSAVDNAVGRLRTSGWTGSEILAPEVVLDRAHFADYVRPIARSLIDAGADEDAVWADLDLLSVHAFYSLSHALHRRKTFWIDESLAFMLAETRLDVRGEGLRLPFDCFALVFTDRDTLALGEALANRDADSNIRGLPLRSMTVYVTRIPPDKGALGLHLSILLDADSGEWPWILTRDLDISNDDMLDEILESRFSDVTSIDPLFQSLELTQVVQLVVNAILYATSSPTWDVIASPVKKLERRLQRGDAKQKSGTKARAELLRKQHTGDDVWHLPGKIPISHVRALREMQRGGHGELFARSMVRGHWRRAPETWTDRNPRWIMPYWKGPDLAAIVEREYRLKL